MGVYNSFFNIIPASAGSAITTAVCNSQDPNQALAYNAASGYIVHTPSGLCVDGAAPRNTYCVGARHNWTICDSSASIGDRAADLVSRISLADKIALLATDSSAPSVGLPGYNWQVSFTRGLTAGELPLTTRP